MLNETLSEHFHGQSFNLVLLEVLVAIHVNIDGLGTPTESNVMIRKLGRW